MAGYDYYNGKSNNAVDAESRGYMVSSKLTKKLKKFFPSITARIIKDTIDASEWHHTSKCYNETNYYHYYDVLDQLASLEKRQEIRQKIRTTKEEKQNKKSLGIKKVKWIEWGRGNYNKIVAYDRQYVGEVIQISKEWILLVGINKRKNIFGKHVEILEIDKEDKQ